MYSYTISPVIAPAGSRVMCIDANHHALQQGKVYNVERWDTAADSYWVKLDGIDGTFAPGRFVLAQAGTHTGPQERTFTESEIVKAVMSFDEGCTEGKLRWLREQLGINHTPTKTVEVTLKIVVPAFDDNGVENYSDCVASVIDDLVTAYTQEFASQFASASGVDKIEVLAYDGRTLDD